MEFSFSVEDLDLCKVIRLFGSLSLSSCENLERFLRDIVKKNSIIINMHEVKLLTTSGMNVLINAGIDAKANGKRVVIANPPADLKEMMNRMHNYEYFIVVDTIEEGKMKIKYYT